MNMKNRLKDQLKAIDNGRFNKIIEALDVKDICIECNHFNYTLNDIRKGYRCKCTPSCIAATLHPDLQSYLLMKINVIDKKEHLHNLGIESENDQKSG